MSGAMLYECPMCSMGSGQSGWCRDCACDLQPQSDELKGQSAMRLHRIEPGRYRTEDGLYEVVRDRVWRTTDYRPVQGRYDTLWIIRRGRRAAYTVPLGALCDQAWETKREAVEALSAFRERTEAPCSTHRSDDR